MINQLEMSIYLEDAVPEIADTNFNKNNPYQAMDSLLKFTGENVRAHNFNAVKRSFQIADKLYSRGNNVVKNAVQNVFVYSLSKIFQSYPAEKKQVLAIIPITLYTLYLTQVCRSGC